jgi:hypothetical protein
MKKYWAPNRAESKRNIKHLLPTEEKLSSILKQKVNKHHEHRPGTVALGEFCGSQKSTAPLIRKLPFQ